jgi:hypothetical protein
MTLKWNYSLWRLSWYCNTWPQIKGSKVNDLLEKMLKKWYFEPIKLICGAILQLTMMILVPRERVWFVDVNRAKKYIEKWSSSKVMELNTGVIKDFFPKKSPVSKFNAIFGYIKWYILMIWVFLERPWPEDVISPKVYDSNYLDQNLMTFQK